MKTLTKSVGMVCTTCLLAVCLAATNGCSHANFGAQPAVVVQQPSQIVATDPRISDQQRAEIEQHIAAQTAAMGPLRSVPSKTQ